MSLRQRPIESLKFAHSMTVGLLKDFPEAQACFQTCPTDNHLLWSVGHLAATYAWMLGLLGHKSEVPEAYMTQFGWGSKPSADSNVYPPLATVRDVMEKAYGSFLRVVAEVPEAQLSQPLGKDAGGFAKDAVELIDRAAWHEGWHAGQVSSLRRALGLPGLMG